MEPLQPPPREVTHCPACGAPGERLHSGLRDRLFGAPGEWGTRRCSAPACGLHWIDPMPDPLTLGELYANYYTHGEGGDEEVETGVRGLYRRLEAGYQATRWGYPAGWAARCAGALLYLHPGRRAGADTRVMYLPARADGALLEVGAGDGSALRRMARLGWQVEGVDFDPAAVAAARAKGVDVRLGDLAAQDYEEGRFDALTMVHVIEHVPDPWALLTEARRVLRPGGRLVLLTPNPSAFGHRLFGADWRGLEPPRHLHLFPPRALAEAARQAGFSQVRCQAVPRARGILVASRMLREAGRVDPLHGPTPTQRLWAEGMEWLEWLFGWWSPEVGEECVLIAQR
ncbi:class I SAM-dependent methyltransferase [Endothiovibrio diazotrophicus]